MTGRTHSTETKRKISESKLGKKRKRFNDQWIANMSLAQSGINNPMYGSSRTHSNETKQKIRQSLLGRKSTRRKSIAQCDLNGNIIKIWNHAEQASEFLGYKSPVNIRRAARNFHLNETVSGFRWKYV